MIENPGNLNPGNLNLNIVKTDTTEIKQGVEILGWQPIKLSWLHSFFMSKEKKRLKKKKKEKKEKKKQGKNYDMYLSLWYN